MSLAALTLAGQSWIGPAVVALLVSGAIVLWSYGRAPASAHRGLGALLKLLGITALLFCLLEPLWSGQRARPGANLFAVAVDDSQSLQVKDSDAPASRGETARTLLDPARNPWQSRLAEDFEIRRYAFAGRLQNLTDFRALSFEGHSSAIGTALKSLSERFRGRPLAGVLLFTDGNATDLPTGTPDLKDLPPIYPVVLGKVSATRDIALARVTVAQSAFEDAPVSVQAEAAVDGFSGERLVAQVLDTQGKVIKEESLSARRDHESLPFRFQFKPEKPGVSFYQVRVARRGESVPAAGSPPAPAAATPPPAAGKGSSTAEATLVNNARVIAVDRGRGPYRILYVSGRPNWEFKFLRRAIQEDPQLDLVALIRVARREPKFQFRGRGDETSNPLFRGFGEQSADAVERFDQPVLIALNTKDDLELKKGFPTTPEELFEYHAVVLDDLEYAFFNPDQAALLQRFVSERGGGLLMLGGAESFREGGYHRTPVGDMLPVYLDRPSENSPEGPLKFDLGREGWLQTWARVRDNEAAERQSIEGMPEFAVANRVRGAKPGASIIGTARDQRGREIPALVTQRFGRGRTAAFVIGDVWRWGLRDTAAHADMDKLWRQSLRWLVADTPAKVEMTAEPIPADPNGALQLEVRARDARHQPLDNASVFIEVTPVAFRDAAIAAAATTPAPGAASGTAAKPTNGPAGNALAGTAPASNLATNTLRLRAEPSPSEAGVYIATFVPRLPGGYRATAVVTNAANLEHGRAEAGWSSELAIDEFRTLTPNLPLLESIARSTGGEVVPADDLESFVKRLPRKKAPLMEAWAEPLWHTPWVFAFALACLLTEWGLRRWKGLP